MLTFNNTHIFTGYLKQLLSTYQLPTCKVYTSDFAQHYESTGSEDPRIVESIHTLSANRPATQVNYIKSNGIYRYFCDYKNSSNKPKWEKTAISVFEPNRHILGLTKTLNSYGNVYDTKTHEYLGDYLRFLRDYYDVNLMSMYNCFTNKIYNNVHCVLEEEVRKDTLDGKETTTIIRPKLKISSYDPDYHIYAFPVKLFSNYTIALDCSKGIELFCGFYRTSLDISSMRNQDLIKRTYRKVTPTLFSQPFLYDALDVKNWTREYELESIDELDGTKRLLDSSTISRLDILNREQDLKLFLKVPTSCKSSIVVLEGDYIGFNDSMYLPQTDTTGKVTWKYQINSWITNFDKEQPDLLNTCIFKPISKLQLLAFNTGESYPFADRLIEYLVGSAITPLDEVSDNIKRTQNVIRQNGHRFSIDGVWENKIQKIIYDQLMNAGPIELDQAGSVVDKRQGVFNRLGHSTRSIFYDILGYVDKDAEKYYASWALTKDKKNLVIADTIQNTDIYNGLYDLK